VATILVYKFTGYDFDNDMPVTSKRWATLEFIQGGYFGLLEQTAIRVPIDVLVDGGLTPHGFDPDSVVHHGGFQNTPPR
jgi:hypothetical protein